MYFETVMNAIIRHIEWCLSLYQALQCAQIHIFKIHEGLVLCFIHCTWALLNVCFLYLSSYCFFTLLIYSSSSPMVCL